MTLSHSNSKCKHFELLSTTNKLRTCTDPEKTGEHNQCFDPKDNNRKGGMVRVAKNNKIFKLFMRFHFFLLYIEHFRLKYLVLNQLPNKQRITEHMLELNF